jgi:hypothetical protein
MYQEQQYMGAVTVARRSPITGARLDEADVMPGDYKKHLRSRPEATTIETPISAKARLKDEWSQWKEERKSRFEQEAHNA